MSAFYQSHLSLGFVRKLGVNHFSILERDGKQTVSSVWGMLEYNQAYDSDDDVHHDIRPAYSQPFLERRPTVVELPAGGSIVGCMAFLLAKDTFSRRL